MTARRAAVAAIVTVAMAVLPTGVAAAEAPAPSAPSAPRTIPSPAGNAEPSLSAAHGKVAVVAASGVVGGRVAVIVQNGTTHAVTNLRVAGSATVADGGAATLATSRFTVPETLAPGAIALAMLDFPRRAVSADAKIGFRVRSQRATGRGDPGALGVTSIVVSAPPVDAAAGLNGRLDAMVVNDSARVVRGPLQVVVMCFTEDHLPATITGALVRRAELRPGASVPVSVALPGTCPTYLVGAHAA